MRRRTWVLAALVGALMPVLLATNLPVARVTLALVACLLLPGLGWARKLGFGDLGDTVALAVVLSICTTVAVGTAMALSDSWSFGWGLVALGGVALAGFVPARLLIDRAGAAVRLRSAGFGDDGGAWATWFRETQQARATQAARAAVTAGEASAVWVDWYADVERRAAEARARESAARQAAVDEWIAWYQRTQLLSPSKGGNPLEPPARKSTVTTRGADEMRIRCVGGGPAGLFFAILARSVGHEVAVYEQAQPAESFGWGVVFWDGLLRQLDAHDPGTGRLVREHAYTWTDQVVVVDGHDPVRIPSFGYSMRRRLLLELLRSRATDVGVHIETGRVTDADAVARGADLVIAGDGVNSTLRRQQPGFGTRVTRLRNKYIWLGSDQEFTSFTFPFVSTHAGWVWGHAYGFDEGASTFVVEMAPKTWTGLGFDRMGPEAAMTKLEQLFAASLEGHRLCPQAGTRDRTPWNEFVVVRNRRWHVGNLVLMGDAAHTTHFTIGSGTRLAMEDAITLSRALATEATQQAALEAYETTRQRQLRNVQREAMRSARWYEQVPRYLGTPDIDFARTMDDRRSPVMAHLPVGLYLGLTRTANKVPGVAEPLKRLVSKL